MASTLRPLTWLAAVWAFFLLLAGLDLPIAVAGTVFAAEKFLLAALLGWLGLRLMDLSMGVYTNTELLRPHRSLGDMIVPVSMRLGKAGVLLVVATYVIYQVGEFDLLGRFLTGLGVAGLAASLAAQDALKSFFGTLLLIGERAFKIGDRILVGGKEGVVEQVGFRSTRLRTGRGFAAHHPQLDHRRGARSTTWAPGRTTVSAPPSWSSPGHPVRATAGVPRPAAGLAGRATPGRPGQGGRPHPPDHERRRRVEREPVPRRRHDGRGDALPRGDQLRSPAPGRVVGVGVAPAGGDSVPGSGGLGGTVGEGGLIRVGRERSSAARPFRSPAAASCVSTSQGCGGRGPPFEGHVSGAWPHSVCNTYPGGSRSRAAWSGPSRSASSPARCAAWSARVSSPRRRRRDFAQQVRVGVVDPKHLQGSQHGAGKVRAELVQELGGGASPAREAAAQAVLLRVALLRGPPSPPGGLPP